MCDWKLIFLNIVTLKTWLVTLTPFGKTKDFDQQVGQSYQTI
jgi:hypothetical protein